MKAENEVLEIIRQLAGRLVDPKSLTGVSPLTPDASLRRYFRLEFSEPLRDAKKTAVAMYFDAVKSPEAGGSDSVTSDDAYVRLTKLFRENKVAVPELYLDARADSVIIIEDLGDRSLAGELLGPNAKNASAKHRQFLQQAVRQIGAIQAVKAEADFFAIKRCFTHTALVNEMLEFLDFVLGDKMQNSDRSMMTAAVETIARAVGLLPTAFTHRDFHAWNLMVDASDVVRVIDFQDALIAPRVYDLVSFVNDRDMDFVLGEERYRELLEQCRVQCVAGLEFFAEFDLTALQRDLKVAGRFMKLSSQRGLKHYEQWVPGTLQRIGRTLGRLSAQRPDLNLSAMQSYLEETIPEIKLGLANSKYYARK